VVSAAATLSGLTPNTTYHYRLVATSVAGTSTSSDITFATSPTPPRPRPTVSGLALAAKTFTAKKGTTLKLTLSEAATVHLTIFKMVSGHKAKGLCMVKAKKGKSCVRAVEKDKRTYTGAKGRNSFKFLLRNLAPGSYRAVGVATDAAGKISKTFRFTFTIRKKSK
jgi:hypothetical protein